MNGVVELSRDQAPSPKRGFYEPYNEYHMSWYPVMVAKDLKLGEVKSLKFCDSRIAVYRGNDGVVRAVSARCKHMGADVGLGNVVGNNVRCPFHHWEYNEHGACVRIPSGDKIPTGTTLFSFPCTETQGLIWVFLGKEPSYDVPFLPDCEEGEVLSHSFELVLDEPMRIEPWALSANTFDFAHFKTVHHFNMSNVTKFSDGYRQGWEGDIEGQGFFRLELIGIGGATTYLQKPGEAPKRHIAGTCPRGGELGVFMTVFADLENDSEEARQDAERRLREKEELHRQVLAEDLRVVNSIEFGKTRLTNVDKDIAEFLIYANKYPRTTIRKLESNQD